MNIIQVENDEYNTNLRDLFSEYLEWVLKMCEREFNITLNIKEMVNDAVNHSIEGLNRYIPPEGHLFLCKYDNFGGICASIVGFFDWFYKNKEIRREN